MNDEGGRAGGGTRPEKGECIGTDDAEGGAGRREGPEGRPGKFRRGRANAEPETPTERPVPEPMTEERHEADTPTKLQRKGIILSPFLDEPGRRLRGSKVRARNDNTESAIELPLIANECSAENTALQLSEARKGSATDPPDDSKTLRVTKMSFEERTSGKGENRL